MDETGIPFSVVPAPKLSPVSFITEDRGTMPRCPCETGTGRFSDVFATTGKSCTGVVFIDRVTDCMVISLYTDNDAPFPI